MSSVRNVIPVGPGSVSSIWHTCTRVSGRRGPSSIQWPASSGVPWTDGSTFEVRGPMYATSIPRTSRYHRIALCRSETTIAIVSMPRTPMFSPGGATKSRAMNLPATFGESLVRGTAAVHLGVPFHDFVVRDAIDLLLYRELVLGFQQIDDPAGGRVALELRDHELPLPPAGFERGDHLGNVEDDVAI